MKYIKYLFLLLLVAIPLALYGAISGTLTTDGNTDWGLYSGHRYTIAFAGDFDSGTITVNYLVGSTYVVFDDGTLTDDGGLEFVMPGPSVGSDENLRITLSGSGSPDIDYVIERIPF